MSKNTIGTIEYLVFTIGTIELQIAKPRDGSQGLINCTLS